MSWGLYDALESLRARATPWSATTGPLAPGEHFPFPPSPASLTHAAHSRRICPGIDVAERILFLAISRLLWAFQISELPSEPISLEEYEGTSGRTPMPYRVGLYPRHERVHATLEAEHEHATCEL